MFVHDMDKIMREVEENVVFMAFVFAIKKF